MDSQQENVLTQCEESWFDAAISCAKEFELPDISSSIYPPWTDTTENLLIPQDQQLDFPTAPDSAFASDISNLLGAETQVALSPIMAMIPQTHFSRSADLLGFEIDGAFPVRNQLVQSPASDSNRPLRNQQFDVVNSTNSPNFNSISSHMENNPTLAFESFDSSRSGSNIITTSNQLSCISVPPNTPGFCSNDCNVSNLASFSGSGSKSAFGSRVSDSIGNQQISYSGFDDAPSFGSNGSCARGNQLAYSPGMTNPPGVRSNGSNTPKCPKLLQNSSHRTKMESNFSNPTRNHVADSNCAPLPNSSGSERDQQAIAPFSLPLRWPKVNCDGSYTCKECDLVFPNYHAFGGHMSYHSRERRLDAKLASQLDASHIDSSRSSHCSRIAKNRTDANNSLSKNKGKSFRPAREAKAMEKALPSDDLMKKGCRHQSSKRLSREIVSPSDVVENRFSPKCKAPRIESSSSDETEESE